MLVLSSHAGLVFEVLCLMSVAYLSNTIYQIQEKIKKICTYENRINFITKMGTAHEEHRNREGGRKRGNESRSSNFYFTIYTLYISFHVQGTG